MLERLEFPINWSSLFQFMILYSKLDPCSEELSPKIRSNQAIGRRFSNGNRQRDREIVVRGPDRRVSTA